MQRKALDFQGKPIRLRCPECRTRRTDPSLMVKHELKCSRPVCHCLSVTHPHRPGSYPLCEHNPMSGLLLAVRAGTDAEEAADIAADIAFNVKGRPSVACPF